MGENGRKISVRPSARPDRASRAWALMCCPPVACHTDFRTSLGRIASARRPSGVAPHSGHGDKSRSRYHPREPFRSPAPYLCEFRLFRLMTLWAVRPDICKAWNDHDVRPEVLRHGNIALGVRHKILSLDVNALSLRGMEPSQLGVGHADCLRVAIRNTIAAGRPARCRPCRETTLSVASNA